ncbi:peroxiredoxin [Parasalinivibrio latis]|uniref:peroxiredoxin n=1 Tax=Parasalinivibrio latis TaxID=2952610 RepID=UPI0030E48BFA
MISLGDSLPHHEFQFLDAEGMAALTTKDLFNNKRVVLFAVPGAFTPTCSEAHLPGYITLADQFQAKGVDAIICLAVNDAFVMKAWGDSQNAEAITMLGDGDGSFCHAMGLAQDTGRFGGLRSQRFSMLAEDGVVKILNVEKPKSFEVSDAQTMLAQI